MVYHSLLYLVRTNVLLFFYMNKQQNISKKQKDLRIRELELENSLLKQKLEMINSIIGIKEVNELVVDEVTEPKTQNSKQNEND